MVDYEQNVASVQMPSAKAMRDYEMEDRDPSDARIGPQLAFMGDQLQKLSALISEHEMRIDQILMPDQERPMNAVPSPPRKPASELSNTIDDLNEQIGRLQNRIQGLTGRVQL